MAEQNIDVVKLARGLGFTIELALDREQDEESGLSWRWLATMKLCDVMLGLGADVKESGYFTEADAARGAILALSLRLNAVVDGPAFEGVVKS